NVPSDSFCSGVIHTLMGRRNLSVAIDLSSPMTKASRYVDILGDRLNLTAFLLPPVTLESTVVVDATSMLERQVIFSSAIRVAVNSALSAGSPKHGRARLASVASNWETASHCPVLVLDL